ncbi:nucleoside-diphosphate sugar epimerase/dehydratase [Synechococcus sp. 1G10]|uniref:polysaccharide biosynthesis protein n=1 Tax=Synechococcus sp. 1G10 TaxID=2025605 RepID=UPI001E503746|nr:nucleoside-diphosphate sugar epimerase/dehydratase [Synechococcus sp. 1G10]
MARRMALIGLDAGLLAFSFWLAFALRLNAPFSDGLRNNLVLLPWAIGIGLAVLLASGWYRGLTRYSGSHSLYSLLPRTGLIVLLLLLVCTLSGHGDPPFRGFWLLFWLLVSGSLIGSRIVLRDVLRYWLAHRPAPQSIIGSTDSTDSTDSTISSQKTRVSTLLFGAGQASNLLLAELRFHPRFRFVAVLDDDPALWGRKLHALTIHPPSQLPDLIARHHIRQVLLAIPSAPRARRRQLVEWMRSLGVDVLSIPSLSAVASGAQSVSDLRPVRIEDLLGRDASTADSALLAAPVRGRTVLVTGAGGSIGSELCRQILLQQPARLVLLEQSEFALYSIEQELRKSLALHARERSQPGELGMAKLVPVLGDVADQPRLQALLRQHGVQVLFHAAAYKHVPLVESNVCAGIANNLLGTRSALEASINCGLERFLLISTDKAVRPTNTMGASKRACELLVQAAAAAIAAAGQGPVCAMVRFGNVLGSSGSVVPLFREQIASGGPVTVTHPEITRYFMTIPEAAQLVLQACGLARGGEVFVLDMGEPLRIIDLARQMIHLSGCSVRDDSRPDGDIAISFTGLRPGEKLYEELLISATDQPTLHPLIRQAKESFLPQSQLDPLLQKLLEALQAWDDDQALAVLRQLVPEYQQPTGPEPACTEAQPRS